MKHKKLLVSLVIIAVVVVIIVIMASVFSVRHIYFNYHKFDGDLTMTGGSGVPVEIAEKIALGKSTIFLSKSILLKQVNSELRASSEYNMWYAFAVVKSFPNVVDVHLVKVTAIAKIRLSTNEAIYIDSFGNQVPAPDYDCIDITSAFVDRKPVATQDGTLKFESNEDNQRLSYVLEAILATWQCYVEIEEMSNVLLPNNAFEFKIEDKIPKMYVSMNLGGKIEIQYPDTNLTERLQSAYGVYYNKKYNLQKEGCVITVLRNGQVTTHDPNKE